MRSDSRIEGQVQGVGRDVDVVVRVIGLRRGVVGAPIASRRLSNCPSFT